MCSGRDRSSMTGASEVWLGMSVSLWCLSCVEHNEQGNVM